MVKKKGPPRGSRKIPSPCATCGQEIETVWMRDGSVRAVDAERVRVIFSNQAQADGREMLVWKPHHPCGEGKQNE